MQVLPVVLKGPLFCASAEPVGWQDEARGGRVHAKKCPVHLFHANDMQMTQSICSCLCSQGLALQEGLLSCSEWEGLWKGTQHPHQGQDPTLGEGASQGTNGPVIHRSALVCTNWFCWPTDSWQGAGLWGTPVSLPPLLPASCSGWLCEAFRSRICSKGPLPSIHHC